MKGKISAWDAIGRRAAPRGISGYFSTIEFSPRWTRGIRRRAGAHAQPPAGEAESVPPSLPEARRRWAELPPDEAGSSGWTATSGFLDCPLTQL